MTAATSGAQVGAHTDAAHTDGAHPAEAHAAAAGRADSPHPVTGVRAALHRRWLRVVVVLGVLAVALAAVGLAVGDYVIPLPDLLATLGGVGDPENDFVVLQLRLPGVMLGLLSGGALALAGGLFQTMLANPLASPDIIGISGGASAGAVTALLVFGLSGPSVALFAFLGAIVAAAVIFALAWRSTLTGARFVLIGIAIAFLVQALIGYLLTRAEVRDAQGALVWLVGSVAGARSQEVALLAIGLALLVPATIVVAPRLRILQLGDSTATALGVRVTATRVAIVVIAAGLTGIAVAFTGPIAFVAFVAGPIARRLVGGLALVPTALVGAVLVIGSDLVASQLLPDTLQVPVGIVTGAIGAPYLLWLLATSNRAGGSGATHGGSA